MKPATARVVSLTADCALLLRFKAGGDFGRLEYVRGHDAPRVFVGSTVEVSIVAGRRVVTVDGKEVVPVLLVIPREAIEAMNEP